MTRILSLCVHRSICLCYGLAMCLIVFTGTRLPAVYRDFQYERSSGGYMNSLYQPQLVQPVNWSTVPPKAKPISCFVITLDSSMPPVKFSEDLTCHPFVGQRVTDDMFKLVSTRVQQNLLQGTSLWGADFTNNISLSIAKNQRQWGTPTAELYFKIRQPSCHWPARGHRTAPCAQVLACAEQFHAAKMCVPHATILLQWPPETRSFFCHFGGVSPPKK